MSGDYTTITDPSAYFHTQLYTGSGSSGLQVRNNANAGDFTPDWLWIKPRSIADNHVLFDSSRGFNKQLKSNGNDAEDTHSPARITRETNGFDVDTTDQNYNQSSATYVAWQWIANGGTTSTNSDGTVDVTIQVNSTAGFSIMKWNGNGNTSGTVGHGLGAVPDMILNKYGLDGTSNWGVAFPKFETSKLLMLNGTGGFTSASGMSSYNSSTFVDGNGASTGGTIAYCFKNVKGYSRFGFYVGNGNTDGPSVYTGFKPAFLMIKRSDGSGYWVMLDSKRNLPNGTGQRLGAQANDAEYGSTNIDFLSNGFKVRASNSDSDTNLDGGTYVYMAFADKPYVTPDGVIATAV
mgnify:CR=1 FL=1